MERKITIEESVEYQEDYQLYMLKVNHLNGLLDITGRGMNEKSYYDYDVTGKISMKSMYERGNLTAKDLVSFLEQLVAVIHEVEKYLLNVNRILLEPEYIYYADGAFYFCYYPLAKKDLWEEFHTLTEYFVKKADYQDQSCVQMVFVLHKGVMEENYSIDKLVQECCKLALESEKKKEAEVEDSFYHTEEHDWIKEQANGSSILRETDNLWTPVKRFLNKHKKQKWGDWDGLYIEEEEL